MKKSFEPNRFDIKVGPKFHVNTKNKLVISTPTVPPWMGDDSSWEDYKSRASSKSKKSAEPPRATSPLAASISTEKKAIKSIVFPASELEGGNADPTASIYEDLTKARKKSFASGPITSGMMHKSVSSIGTGSFAPFNDSAAPATHPLNYTTIQFSNGNVEMSSTTKSTSMRPELNPVGDFYLPKKLSKSISLPSIARPSPLRVGSLVDMSMSKVGQDFNDEINDMELHDSNQSSQVQETGEEKEAADVPTGTNDTREDNTGTPPVATFQIHNRVLGSKLLPLSKSRDASSSPRRGIRSAGPDTAHLREIKKYAGDEDNPVPFQIHKRVMGWKLTSMKRRQELVSLLDIINSKDDIGQRLKKALEDQGVLPGEVNILATTAPADIEKLQAEMQARQKSGKRMAASWERAVSRIIKARVGVLDGKAEYQRHKKERDAAKERRRHQLLAESFSPRKGEVDWEDGNDDDFFALDSPVPNGLSAGRKSRSTLISGPASERDASTVDFGITPNYFDIPAADPIQSRTMSRGGRAASPSLLRQFDSRINNTDLLALNDRMDILKS